MISQTPWIERTFHFDFPATHFPVIFSRLEGTLFRLSSILSSADDEHCGNSNNGWSVKQHLGHLFDLEALWWTRLEEFRNNAVVLSAADMSNQKTSEAGHNEKSLEQLLQQFVPERQKMLEVIYGFDLPFLQRTALHPRLQQPMRVVDLLFFVAEHDDHHITRISNLLRKPWA